MTNPTTDRLREAAEALAIQPKHRFMRDGWCRECSVSKESIDAIRKEYQRLVRDPRIVLAAIDGSYVPDNIAASREAGPPTEYDADYRALPDPLIASREAGLDAINREQHAAGLHTVFGAWPDCPECSREAGE